MAGNRSNPLKESAAKAETSSKPANTQPAPQDPDFMDPGVLNFDLQNPRFVNETFKDENEVIQYLYDNADVDELIQSILSAGYVDFEPLIVQRQSNIVFEGNRRLAALRLISREDLRKNLKITLPTIPNPQPLSQQVRVRWVTDRSEARAFVGFKHINGPFRWDALAKAKYAAQWFQDGGDIESISRMLGDNHNTVRRLVTGWYVLEQAINDGFDVDQISKRNLAFSHLYIAITRASVREMLGLTAEALSSPPKPNPVATEHRDDLAMLMSWLYGQEQKGEPTIIQSQNPNLNELSKVLANPEAKLMLVTTRDLRAAFERVEPPSTRFEEALMLASKQAEEATSLSGFYDGEPTLLRVGEGLNKTARSLLVVMRDRVSGRSEES
jgi:hypothetical protein